MNCCFLTRCKNMNYEHNLFLLPVGGLQREDLEKLKEIKM